jgi:quinol-cytochrome oxidoreductase complex cytochrome b subunit
MNGVKNNLSILLQHWPYNTRCWIMFVMELLVPSLILVSPDWLFGRPSLGLSYVMSLILLKYIDRKKTLNLHIASFWMTFSWAVIVFFGFVLLPALFRLGQYDISAWMVEILMISPFVYFITLKSIPYYCKTDIQQKQEK